MGSISSGRADVSAFRQAAFAGDTSGRCRQTATTSSPTPAARGAEGAQMTLQGAQSLRLII